MFRSEMFKLYRRLVVLAVLVVCLFVATSSSPGVRVAGVAEASSGDCCGNDNPFVQCASCAAAIRSCRLSCGGLPYNNFCLWEFSCNPSDPSNYTCVCRPEPPGTLEEPGSCTINYC
jgi:hypothetical protein